MTKDRIKDLQTDTSWPTVSYTKLSRQLLNHDEDDTDGHSTTINIDNQCSVNDFLKETDSIRLVIDNIHELTQRVKNIQFEMLQPTANPKLAVELDEIKEKIKNLAYQTSLKLKNMEKSSVYLDNKEKTKIHWRIRESQVFVLTRSFRDAMALYNQEIILHRDRCKKVISRELDISGCRKSNDELEDILENGFPGTYNFSILVDTQKTVQSLNEIEARHRDIIKLESSIKELHDMFLDLAVFVADQGEMIDCIEYNVSKAIDFVEDATDMVDTAGKYKKKSNKKTVFLLIIISISIILILFIFLLAFIIRKKSKRQ